MLARSGLKKLCRGSVYSGRFREIKSSLVTVDQGLDRIVLGVVRSNGNIICVTLSTLSLIDWASSVKLFVS